MDKNDLVNREDLRNALYEADAITMKGVDIINNFHAAAAEERRGWWNVYSAKNSLYTCSVCNHLPVSKTPYCPFCGARMENYRDV